MKIKMRTRGGSCLSEKKGATQAMMREAEKIKRRSRYYIQQCVCVYVCVWMFVRHIPFRYAVKTKESAEWREGTRRRLDTYRRSNIFVLISGTFFFLYAMDAL